VGTRMRIRTGRRHRERGGWGPGVRVARAEREGRADGNHAEPERRGQKKPKAEGNPEDRGGSII
jgi:hypothetical protein